MQPAGRESCLSVALIGLRCGRSHRARRLARGVAPRARLRLSHLSRRSTVMRRFQRFPSAGTAAPGAGSWQWGSTLCTTLIVKSIHTCKRGTCREETRRRVGSTHLITSTLVPALSRPGRREPALSPPGVAVRIAGRGREAQAVSTMHEHAPVIRSLGRLTSVVHPSPHKRSSADDGTDSQLID